MTDRGLGRVIHSSTARLDVVAQTGSRRMRVLRQPKTLMTLRHAMAVEPENRDVASVDAT